MKEYGLLYLWSKKRNDMSSLLRGDM